MSARKAASTNALEARGAALRRGGAAPDAKPTIVVATDFSEGSAAATTAAGVLAERLGARLIVIHTLTLVPIAHADFVWVPTAAEIEAETREVEAKLRDVQDRLARAHQRIAVTTKVVTGTLPDAVVDAAASEKADLLVVGTHGRGFWSNVVLGSVARSVSLASTVPVLTVRNAPTDPRATTILAPVELGRVAERALDLAAGLASALSAKLRLLYVFPGDAEASAADGDASPAQIALASQVALDRIAGPERARDLEVECVTRFGRPARQIAAEAAACDAALVVVGASKHGFAERATGRSISEDVLHGSSRPVITWTLPSGEG